MTEAVTHYEKAMHTPFLDPRTEEWATCQEHLASALFRLTTRDPRTNVERGLAHVRASLQLLTKNRFPIKHALAKCTLARGLSRRVGTFSAASVEAAIGHCKDAVSLITAETQPLHWARFHRHLGRLYVSRARGDSDRNLEAALNHYRSAIDAPGLRDDYPDQWMVVQLALARALRPLLFKMADAVMSTTVLYDKLLVPRMQEVSPELYGLACAEKGSVFLDASINLEPGDSQIAECVNQAYVWANEAIQLISKQAWPERWARCRVHAAMALLKRGGNGSEDTLKALDLMRKALQVYTKERYLADHTMCWRNIGLGHYALNNLPAARMAFSRGRDTSNEGYLIYPNSEAERAPFATNHEICTTFLMRTLLAMAASRDYPAFTLTTVLPEILVMADERKTMALWDHVERDTLMPTDAPPLVREELELRNDQVREEGRKATYRLRFGLPAHPQDKRREAEADLVRLREEYVTNADPACFALLSDSPSLDFEQLRLASVGNGQTVTVHYTWLDEPDLVVRPASLSTSSYLIAVVVWEGQNEPLLWQSDSMDRGTLEALVQDVLRAGARGQATTAILRLSAVLRIDEWAYLVPTHVRELVVVPDPVLAYVPWLAMVTASDVEGMPTTLLSDRFAYGIRVQHSAQLLHRVMQRRPGELPAQDRTRSSTTVLFSPDQGRTLHETQHDTHILASALLSQERHLLSAWLKPEALRYSREVTRANCLWIQATDLGISRKRWVREVRLHEAELAIAIGADGPTATGPISLGTALVVSGADTAVDALWGIPRVAQRAFMFELGERLCRAMPVGQAVLQAAHALRLYTAADAALFVTTVGEEVPPRPEFPSDRVQDSRGKSYRFAPPADADTEYPFADPAIWGAFCVAGLGRPMRMLPKEDEEARCPRCSRRLAMPDHCRRCKWDGSAEHVAYTQHIQDHLEGHKQTQAALYLR